MFGSGKHSLELAKQTALIISNEEIDDIMKIDLLKDLIY